MNLEQLAFISAAVFLDGLAGLAGGLFSTAFIHRHLASLLAFASGTLVGVAFLDLLPEALSSGLPHYNIMSSTLMGFMSFYVIESFLGSHATGQSGHKHTKLGPLILLGDAVHNATDGVAIAASFMVSTQTGIATTLAVIVHELPQEVSDYSILLAQGYTKRQALFSLFLVQLSAFVGAFFTLFAASTSMVAIPYLTALSAGGFMYIAAADLLPELQRHKENSSAVIKLFSFLLGLAIIILLTRL